MRLNRYVALSSKYSRRQADALIAGGHVKVNGQTVYGLGTQVTSNHDRVELYGRAIRPRHYVYYALNKPVGYASTTFDPFAARKVTDLVPRRPRVYPVGRLDRNSEGLLILTNDGDFTYLLTHPRHFIDKEYYVEAVPRQEDWDTTRLREITSGMELDGYETKPTKIHGWKYLKGKVSFYIILREGRKRQIRRLAQKIGLQVMVLRRVRIGRLRLSNIKPGHYDTITPERVLGEL